MCIMTHKLSQIEEAWTQHKKRQLWLDQMNTDNYIEYVESRGEEPDESMSVDMVKWSHWGYGWKGNNYDG